MTNGAVVLRTFQLDSIQVRLFLRSVLLVAEESEPIIFLASSAFDMQREDWGFRNNPQNIQKRHLSSTGRCAPLS
jgi:hypothetical protein